MLPLSPQAVVHIFFLVKCGLLVSFKFCEIRAVGQHRYVRLTTESVSNKARELCRNVVARKLPRLKAPGPYNPRSLTMSLSYNV